MKNLIKNIIKQILLESDLEHRDALLNTGFWGKQGAGCIIAAKKTKRLLLPLRSRYVEQPNTWGTWGGAIDNTENPLDAAKRELYEEAGYIGNAQMIPLSIFQKDTFKYFNFLAIVKDEFEPTLNWETQDYIWTRLDNLPSPLHFGLKWVLEQDYNKIQNTITNIEKIY
jgi:8-oxo-dGTP pyrophosphatase MutT (NUDIX family)